MVHGPLVFGALAVLVAVLADPLGIGTKPGFGLHQSALLALGVIVVFVGGLSHRRGRRRHPRA